MKPKIDKALILKEIKRHFSFEKDVDFARALGISPQNLTQWLTRGAYDVNILATAFPTLNVRWVVTGVGEIEEEKKFIDNSQNIGGDGIIGDNSQMNVNMATEQQNKIELLESKLEAANREIELLKGQIELYKDLLNAKK